NNNDTSDIDDNHDNKKITNKFFIYRKAWVSYIQSIHGNKKYKMTDMSSFIKGKWNKEPKERKDYYSQIAEEAKRINTLAKRNKSNGTESSPKRKQPKQRCLPTPSSPSIPSLSSRFPGPPFSSPQQQEIQFPFLLSPLIPQI